MCDGQQETEEREEDIKKEDNGWFGATNWKQKVVWAVAITVYATIYQSVLTPFSKVIRIGLASVFGAIVGLLTHVFRDQHGKQPLCEQEGNATRLRKEKG